MAGGRTSGYDGEWVERVLSEMYAPLYKNEAAVNELGDRIPTKGTGLGGVPSETERESV
jgi:hypothetical protein